MPYYKIPNDNSPWFLSDEQVARGAKSRLPAGWMDISDAEADAMRAPPFETVKAEARSDLISKRNASITSGFAYLGKTIDSDRDSVMSITGAAVAALAAKAAGLPYSVDWTCADDSTLTLDADGVLGMAVTLAMFADAQHAKARPLKDAIKNAADVATLKAVKW